MRFVPIPAGRFTMGDGKTAHKVTLTQSFHLGQHEVTQEQFERVMGRNPSRFKSKQNPVENVSWDDAVEFCLKLSELPSEKSAGYVYRLTPEAEWEYACRAGTTTKYSFGDFAVPARSDSELGEYAWYGKNSETPRIQLARRSRTGGGCMTYTVTCGSIARTGTVIFRALR